MKFFINIQFTIMSEVSNECPICIESYTDVARARIVCTKCEYECCKICFKRYIVDEEHYLSCMSCHTTFDRTTLRGYLGMSFMQKNYRDIRELQLYEQEKAYFAATQNVIDHIREIEKLRRQIDNLNTKYDNIRIQRMEPLKAFRFSMDIMTVKAAVDEFERLRSNVEIVDEQLQDERRSIESKISEMEDSKKVTKRTYVMTCPGDNCKGMLSNESSTPDGHLVCSICNTHTCSECQMQVLDNVHVCNPDILETVRYMQSTSKACPSCGVRIHKISGCNQMFCTSCHASFDWRTLRLNNGAVHNPHHAEWLRNNRNRPRELADVPCGRELSIDHAIICDDYMKTASAASNPDKKQRAQNNKAISILFDAIRVAVHHHHETIPSLGRNRNGQHTNQQLRIQLLKNIINEATFMKEIQRRDKQASKRNELLQVVLTFRDALTDIIWPFVSQQRNSRPIEDWLTMVDEIKELINYVNGCFESISQVYSSTRYEIMDHRSIR